MSKIVIIDDEEKICFAFKEFLSEEGHEVYVAARGEEGLEIVSKENPEIVFLDFRLPGESGVEILKKIKALSPQSSVILMTAYGTMEVAIRAMQEGAYEYLPKPIDLDKVGDIVNRIIASSNFAPEVAPKESLVSVSETMPTLIGKSPAMQEIFKLIGLLTTNDLPVLLLGESGVGKEVVARSIHYNSSRKNDPFVAINCGAIPENLVEAELFGFEKGAFTSAEQTKPGKFEIAGKGTIFLDEISEIPLGSQVKLLRVLQEKTYEPLGSVQTKTVQARIIAATNKPLDSLVRDGAFREDLYYRLQLITIHVPPLRERIEDIPLLSDYLLRKANKELGTSIEGIDLEALSKLCDYNWPGNVRELENVLKRAAIMAQKGAITVHHLKLEPAEATEEKTKGYSLEDAVKTEFRRYLEKRNEKEADRSGVFQKILHHVETCLIEEALRITGNNQVQAASLLGISRTTLRAKIITQGNNK